MVNVLYMFWLMVAAQAASAVGAFMQLDGGVARAHEWQP